MIEKKDIATAITIGGNLMIVVGLFQASSPDIRRQLRAIGTIIAGSSFLIVGSMMYQQAENLRHQNKNKE